jgi:hypothetical protein
MGDVESLRFNGTIRNAAGELVGEARMWGAGERGPDGAWGGWLTLGDLGGQLPAGRYTITAFEGWSGQVEVGEYPPTRVFETELMPMRGIGPVPWPPADPREQPPCRLPPIGTPWQGATDMPPFKWPGYNDPYPRRRPPPRPAKPLPRAER